MWLIGNVNVENTARESVGILGEVRIPFELPRKARGRRRIKIRYVGYHAGAFLSKIQSHMYEANSTAEAADYIWRSGIRELRVRVLADGVNVMHDSVGWRSVRYLNGKDIETEHATDYLTYPATQATDAMSHNGTDQLENSFFQPFPVHRGHHQMQDISLGFVEEHVSKLEVVLTAEHISAFAVSTNRYSHEPNVRMDTISIVLELV